MKQKELREIAACAICNKKIGSSPFGIFHRVSIQTFSLCQDAIQRQAGLEMMLGSPAIAAAMGPDEDLAKPLGDMMETETVTVCFNCYLKPIHLAVLFNKEE